MDSIQGRVDVPGRALTYDGLWRVLSESERTDGALWMIVPDKEATRHARIGKAVVEFMERHGVVTVEDLLGKENHQKVARWRALCRAISEVWE
jgi:hypothetical protein